MSYNFSWTLVIRNTWYCFSVLQTSHFPSNYSPIVYHFNLQYTNSWYILVQLLASLVTLPPHSSLLPGQITRKSLISCMPGWQRRILSFYFIEQAFKILLIFLVHVFRFTFKSVPLSTKPLKPVICSNLNSSFAFTDNFH